MTLNYKLRQIMDYAQSYISPNYKYDPSTLGKLACSICMRRVLLVETPPEAKHGSRQVVG